MAVRGIRQMRFSRILVDISERYVRNSPPHRLHWYKNETTLVVQVFRVLKPNATFLYITYRQPHFIRPLLNRDGVNWDLQVDILGGGDSSFDYHGFVLKKVTTPV